MKLLSPMKQDSSLYRTKPKYTLIVSKISVLLLYSFTPRHIIIKLPIAGWFCSFETVFSMAPWSVDNIYRRVIHDYFIGVLRTWALVMLLYRPTYCGPDLSCAGETLIGYTIYYILCPFSFCILSHWNKEDDAQRRINASHG